MTYYDLIKKYSKGFNDDKMWNAVKRISDFIEPLEEEDPKKYWRMMKGTYYDIRGGHYDEAFAEWQIKAMFYVDKDGKTYHAPYWNISTMTDVYEKVRNKIKNKEYNVYDFMVVLNMIKSDHYVMYKYWWPELSDKDLDAKFVEASINWLNDDDSPYGTEKVWLYFNS